MGTSCVNVPGEAARIMSRSDVVAHRTCMLSVARPSQRHRLHCTEWFFFKKNTDSLGFQCTSFARSELQPRESQVPGEFRQVPSDIHQVPTPKHGKNGKIKPILPPCPGRSLFAKRAPRPITYGCTCFIGVFRWELKLRWRIIGQSFQLSFACLGLNLWELAGIKHAQTP